MLRLVDSVGTAIANQTTVPPAGTPKTPLTVVAGAAALRPPWASRFALLHPKAYLGLHGVVGLGLAAACVWVFFAIADAFSEHGPMVRLDMAVAAGLQSHGNERGESIFTFVSLLGGQVLAVLLVIAALVLLARRDWRHLVMIAVTAGGGALLNLALKSAFHRARPSFAAEFPVTSSSFPSGHAMDSLIGYGLLAYWLGSRFPRTQRSINAVVVALVALIGFARIYLGVHYLSDVIAGYSAGFIWLMVSITGYRFAESRRVGPSGKDE